MASITVNIQGLFPKQEEILRDLINDKDTGIFVLRASRQAGKSHILIRAMQYFALSKKSINIAFINYENKLSLNVYDILIASTPKELISHNIRSDGDRHISFINGSKISFFTSKNYNGIRGPSFDMLFCDEFAYWPTDAWTSIYPTVAGKKDTKIILASTPRGKNHFYDLSIQGNSSDPYVKEYFFTYKDNPFYNEAVISNAKKTWTDMAFRQEFLAEFVFGKGTVFGEFSHLQKISSWTSRDTNERYFFGIDVAGSGDDDTVLTILDSRGNTVLVYEAKESRIPNQANELTPIILSYDAEGYCECNGLGIGLCEGLQDNGAKCSKFWMTNESKNELVSNTLRDIANSSIVLPTVELCSKLDNQMSTYEVSRTPTGKLTYAHPKGLHDDYPDSFNIANWARYKFLFGGGNVWDPSEQREQTPNPFPTTIDMRATDYSSLYD